MSDLDRIQAENEQLQARIDWLISQLAKYAGTSEDTARIKYLGRV
ncbi:MAG TPA: hypothetical protein VK054_13580 [Beutenbergiaceae bacterium]|nr:hypothetical protein [Beutenbergiaceae bacterium]